jgi:hypothetical protein
VIYLVLAVAAQVAAGAAYACAGNECSMLPEGFAGVGILVALLASTAILDALLTWKAFPLRRVWPVGCLSSILLISIHSVEDGVQMPDGWLYWGLGWVVTTSPLWLSGWSGLLVGEVVRRARGAISK